MNSSINKIAVLTFLLAMVACKNGQQKNDQEVKNDHTLHGNHAALSSSGDHADSVNTGLITTDTLKGSPHRTAMRTIAGTHVHIEYSSPGVKGRVIWGGLVAMRQVWVAGAHDATSIRFYKNVVIDNKEIKAGTYAFFVIPDNDKWTLILNTRYDQHLADEYNEAEDVIRVQVDAEQHTMTQRLTYEVSQTGDKTAVVSLLWENIKVDLPFKVL